MRPLLARALFGMLLRLVLALALALPAWLWLGWGGAVLGGAAALVLLPWVLGERAEGLLLDRMHPFHAWIAALLGWGGALALAGAARADLRWSWWACAALAMILLPAGAMLWGLVLLRLDRRRARRAEAGPK